MNRIEYLNVPNPNVFYQTQHYQLVAPNNPLNRLVVPTFIFSVCLLDFIQLFSNDDSLI